MTRGGRKGSPSPTGSGYDPTMSSALPFDLSAIPEDQRDAVLAVLRERDAMREANKHLEHLIAEVNQAVHGKRSKKLSEDERQLAFEDLEVAVAEFETQQDEQAQPQASPLRAVRHNRGNLPKELSRIEKVIEPDSLDCPCGCGCGEMHRIGAGRTERLDIIPAQIRVIVTVRPKYACRACAEGVTQAPAPRAPDRVRFSDCGRVKRERGKSVRVHGSLRGHLYCAS